MPKRSSALEFIFDLPSIIAFAVIVTLFSLAMNYFFSTKNFLQNALVTWAAEGKINVKYYEDLSSKIDPDTLIFCLNRNGKVYLGACKLDFSNLDGLYCKVSQIYKVKTSISNCGDLVLQINDKLTRKLSGELSKMKYNTNIYLKLDKQVIQTDYYYLDYILLNGLANVPERVNKLAREIGKLYGYYIVTNKDRLSDSFCSIIKQEFIFTLLGKPIQYYTASDFLYFRIDNKNVYAWPLSGVEISCKIG